MKQEVSQLLVSLNKFNATDTHSIFIPSLGREALFNSLTVKQQKDILKSAFDVRTGVFSFIEILNQLIAESCKESLNFNIIDKSYIALHFKSLFFKGKTYAKKKDEDVVIDLEAHIKNIKKEIIPQHLLKRDITIGPITAECSLPSLSYESSISAETKSIISNLIKDKKEENIKDVVGEVYIFEILKFLNSIKYIFNNEPVTVNMNDLNLKDKASVFENLPSTLNNGIIDYIKEIRNFEKKYLEVGDATITIDPIFFNKTD